jgi:hypothetical protein
VADAKAAVEQLSECTPVHERSAQTGNDGTRRDHGAVPASGAYQTSA